MIEIKFRGKRIDNGEWVTGFYVKSVNDRAYIIIYATEDAANTRNEIDFLYIEVIPKTVGQFTGLYDKNGVEICEGDVLHCVSRWDSGDMVVIFADGEFRMVLLEKGDGFYAIRCFDKEVIGNIHDQED